MASTNDLSKRDFTPEVLIKEVDDSQQTHSFMSSSGGKHFYPPTLLFGTELFTLTLAN